MNAKAPYKKAPIQGTGMLLDPLCANANVDFVINNNGNAMILHKGPLRHDYSWVQFDSFTNTIQLVTEEGETQDLGYVIPERIQKSLAKTGEISLFEIGDNNHCTRHVLTVFNSLLV